MQYFIQLLAKKMDARILTNMKAAKEITQLRSSPKFLHHFSGNDLKNEIKKKCN